MAISLLSNYREGDNIDLMHFMTHKIIQSLSSDKISDMGETLYFIAHSFIRNRRRVKERITTF